MRRLLVPAAILVLSFAAYAPSLQFKYVQDSFHAVKINPVVERGDADLLWLTDPLSVQSYEAEGLLAPLEGAAFDVVPDAFKGDTFVGTRLLNLVLVAGDDVEPQPIAWSDLIDPAYADRVVLPDPGFAGSAFAAFGYLSTADGYGMDFYEALRDNGASQVASPVDTLTAVAEGNQDVGITLDKIARASIDNGAPIKMIWPEPGAIALFSPAAVVAHSDDLGRGSCLPGVPRLAGGSGSHRQHRLAARSR